MYNGSRNGRMHRKPDEMKHIHFLNKDEQWLIKYNKIWDKVSNNIKQNLTVIPSKIKKI